MAYKGFDIFSSLQLPTHIKMSKFFIVAVFAAFSVVSVVASPSPVKPSMQNLCLAAIPASID